MADWLLVDNGSLRPASTLRLRELAAALSRRVGENVRPVSLLHSGKIPPGELGGESAVVLEPSLRRGLENGQSVFRVIPLFFGPSRALTDYLPKRATALRRRFPDLDLRIAPVLCDADRGGETRVAEILRDHVLERLAPEEPPPPVVLVDHGSPEPAVARARNFVAGQLSVLLGGRAARVAAASMERRDGDEFRFNEPLLADLLAREGFNSGKVVVAMMFLSPGRHAGPGGDVATICGEAEAGHPDLKTVMTRLAGEHPLLLDILADRFTQLRAGAGMAC